MGEFVKVARAGKIAPGQARAVEAEGKRIALFNVDGTFHAINDTCTHRGGPLSFETALRHGITDSRQYCLQASSVHIE